MTEVKGKPGESIDELLKRVPIIRTFYSDGTDRNSPQHTRRPEVPIWIDSVSTVQEIDPDSQRPVIKMIITYRPFSFFE